MTDEQADKMLDHLAEIDKSLRTISHFVGGGDDPGSQHNIYSYLFRITQALASDRWQEHPTTIMENITLIREAITKPQKVVITGPSYPDEIGERYRAVVDRNGRLTTTSQ